MLILLVITNNCLAQPALALSDLINVDQCSNCKWWTLMDDITWSPSNHVAAWPASKAGFDADSHLRMGKEWGNFISIFQSCLELVEKVPMEQCGWEEHQANGKLVKAMEPWPRSQAGQASIDANNYWTTFWCFGPTTSKAKCFTSF